jgi:hypothetical protein
MKNFTGVYELESDSQTIYEALGISEERNDEIIEILEKCVKKHDTISSTFVEIWSNVEHPNEFAYAVFEYGVKMGTQKTIHRMIGDLGKK